MGDEERIDKEREDLLELVGILEIFETAFAKLGKRDQESDQLTPIGLLLLTVTSPREETLGELMAAIRSMAEVTPEELRDRHQEFSWQDQAAKIVALKERAKLETEIAELAAAGELRATLPGLRNLGYTELATRIEEGLPGAGDDIRVREAILGHEEDLGQSAAAGGAT